MGALLAWATNAAQAPAVLVGHSAGSQFLDRVAAYAAPAGVPMIIANPSTWVMPSAAPPPFGFGALPEAALRTYLALPITVLLGGDDNRQPQPGHERRSHGAGAEPPDLRPERLAEAQAVARQHGCRSTGAWPSFPASATTRPRMFASQQAAAALPR